MKKKNKFKKSKNILIENFFSDHNRDDKIFY